MKFEQVLRKRLFFGRDQNGVCPAGGNHDPSNSGDYQLLANLEID
jgi:hypothetical protein